MEKTTFDELELFCKASSFAKNLSDEEFKEFLESVKKVVDKQKGNSRSEKLKQIRLQTKENEDSVEDNEFSNELESLFAEGTLGCKVLMHYINKYIPLIYKISYLYPELDRNDFLTPAYFSIKNCLIRFCPEERNVISSIDTVIYSTLNHDLVNFAFKERNLIKIPDKVGIAESKVSKIVNELTIELGRYPYPNEVLNKLENDPGNKGKFDLKKISELMSLSEQTDVVSLDRKIGGNNDSSNEEKVTEIEDDEYLTYGDEAKYLFEKVKDKLLKTVSPKNWDIFMKCNVLGYSCTLVGKEYGVSRQAINRIANDVEHKFKKAAKELYGKN